MTTGPALAAASCTLAIFRLLYFIAQNSACVTTKPRSEPRTLSAPEGTVRLRRCNKGAHELGKCDEGHSVVPGQSPRAWLPPLLLEAKLLGHRESQPLPALREKRWGSPDRFRRALKQQHGSFQPLESSQSRGQNRLEPPGSHQKEEEKQMAFLPSVMSYSDKKGW